MTRLSLTFHDPYIPATISELASAAEFSSGTHSTRNIMALPHSLLASPTRILKAREARRYAQSARRARVGWESRPGGR